MINLFLYSKLLSHTIKMGKGGAEGAILVNNTIVEESGTVLNADDVDRNIEYERDRQRINEKIEFENKKNIGTVVKYIYSIMLIYTAYIIM
jgi:hypothetical protein